MNVRDTSSIVVRRYGLLAPVDWDEDCEDELRRMAQFWKRLVEIEDAYREAFTSATAADAAVVAIESELTSLIAARQTIRISDHKERRAVGKSRKNFDPRGGTISELSARITELSRSVKDARRAARQAMQPELRQLESWRRAAVKEARQTSGLWWSNYNAVVSSYEHARQAALRRGKQLRFHRSDGSGRIVNQIQGGMSVEDLFSGNHSQVKVSPVTPRAWSVLPHGMRRKLARTTLTVTVYTRNRVPRTVSWPMLMHRPIPADARIKQVIVRRERVADYWEWSVSFLCRVPTQPTTGIAAENACGIDIGWRRVNDGVRVATIVSSHYARPSHIILPEAIVKAARHVESLQSARDQALNAMIARLRTTDWSAAPSDLADSAKLVLAMPRPSAHRLVALWRFWSSIHPYWHGDMLADLAAWHRRDRRDWRQIAGMKRRLQRSRQDLYLNEAARLVKVHGLIAIEAISIADLQHRLQRNNASPMPDAARWYARLAAPSELLTAIERQAAKAGATIFRHRGKSTWICADCGTEQAPSNPAELIHTCPRCSATWDQDANAARNILAAALADASLSQSPSALASGKDRVEKSFDRSDLTER